MNAIGQLLFLIVSIFQIILLARVLLSWFPTLDRSNPTVDQVVRLIYDITEPVLRPVREMLPQTGMVDFSPLVVFLIISVLLQLIPVIF